MDSQKPTSKLWCDIWSCSLQLLKLWMLFKQVDFVSFKDICVIRRIPSVEKSLSWLVTYYTGLTANLHFVESTIFVKSFTCPCVTYFPLSMCIQDTVLSGWGWGLKVMSLFPCGVIFLICQTLQRIFQPRAKRYLTSKAADSLAVGAHVKIVHFFQNIWLWMLLMAWGEDAHLPIAEVSCT